MRVTAHALDHGDLALVVHGGVAVDLHDGGGDVLGRGREARAVVGAVQVVVDGLGNAHHAALIAVLQHELADLVAGVHAVVAAVVEEVAHVVLLEDLQDALVVGVVHIGVGQLIAAGTQRGGRGVLHVGKLLGIFLAHVDQVVVQHALDAVQRAQDLGDVLILQRGLDRAVGGSVDDGAGAAGLTDDTCAFQLAHCHSFLSKSMYCFRAEAARAHIFNIA